MTSTPNQYQQLRQARLREATRTFRARGASVERCEQCQLARFACICRWCRPQRASCDFVVLMHPREVFKPTNSGRLIADLLPENTQVYLWDRTKPDANLLALLQSPRRQCLLVYPAQPHERHCVQSLPQTDKRVTFILLDGTWKQSGRMFHLSRWLDPLPCLSLPEQLVRGYAVRRSHQEHYLSTLEAAGLCLQLAGEVDTSSYCLDFFALFNQHYLATRGCYPPVPGELHQRLSEV